MVAVTLQEVRVELEGTEVLHGIDLHVGDGSLVAVVGASGSGKSTLLRAVAGLDPVTSGRVLFDDEDVTAVATRDRDLAMVFQTASLQPHLDVAGNLAFPLKLRRTPATEVVRRVEAEARAFGIRRLLRRRPRTMSSGERHTASVAHAMVRVPRAVLMDEPLAAVDIHRRNEVIQQLLEVQSGSGATLLLATNDQAIAAAVADEVVVLDEGRVLGSGTYTDLYERPRDTTIAQLIGARPMNLLPAASWDEADGLVVDASGAEFRFPQPLLRAFGGARLTLGVRPERLVIAPLGAADGWDGEVVLREFAGSRVHVHVDIGDHRLVAGVPAPGPARGERVGLVPRRVSLFDPDGYDLVHVDR